MKKKFFYVGPRGGMPHITYAVYDYFVFDFLLKYWPYHHREMKKI
jgi:hypothetical protein